MGVKRGIVMRVWNWFDDNLVRPALFLVRLMSERRSHAIVQ